VMAAAKRRLTGPFLREQRGSGYDPQGVSTTRASAPPRHLSAWTAGIVP
jgi:hypothetical protein